MYPSTSHQLNSLHYIEEAISIEEENILLSYLHGLLKNKKYQGAHWDNVISRYRELELTEAVLPDTIKPIISSLKVKIECCLKERVNFLPVHVIDLAKTGFISPHIDSIKFSGKLIAGLSLQSERLMHLVHSEVEAEAEPKKLGVNEPQSIEIRLPPRSLYILTDLLRYNYSHQIYADMCNHSLAADDATAATAGSNSSIQHSKYMGPTCYPKSNAERRISLIIRDAVGSRNLSPLDS